MRSEKTPCSRCRKIRGAYGLALANHFRPKMAGENWKFLTKQFLVVGFGGSHPAERLHEMKPNPFSAAYNYWTKFQLTSIASLDPQTKAITIRSIDASCISVKFNFPCFVFNPGWYLNVYVSQRFV